MRSRPALGASDSRLETQLDTRFKIRASRLVLLVGYAVWHMSRCDVLSGEITVSFLVVKKHVGTIRSQKVGLLEPAKKNRLVNTNVPSS